VWIGDPSRKLTLDAGPGPAWLLHSVIPLPGGSRVGLDSVTSLVLGLLLALVIGPMVAGLFG